LNSPQATPCSTWRAARGSHFRSSLAAAIAGTWAKPAAGFRTATVLAGAVAVFSAVSFGIAYADHNVGIQAPESVVVDGQPMSLQQGRIFLFFYSPVCSHCQAAAATMAKLKFKEDVKIIAIPTHDPQWAQGFLDDYRFTAAHTSLEVEKLREVFKFEYPPQGFLIEDGRQTGTIPQYDDNGEPEATLRKLGLLE
jgi:thiol-disulfide isomerase/thioredoxin